MFNHKGVFVVRVIDPGERDWICARAEGGEGKRRPGNSADWKGHTYICAGQTGAEGR